MRYDDQTVDLVVARIGKRKHHPIGTGLACPHLDAADDAVAAGRRRDLNTVSVGREPVDGIGEVDGGSVDRHIDRLGGAKGRRNQQRDQDDCRDGDVQNPQAAILPVSPSPGVPGPAGI